MIDLLDGWDAGSAEDLDITIRIKNYFRRSKNGFKIIFDPEAVGHTDVPETLFSFLKQRQRWDGDLSFIYIRKHSLSFNPRIMVWPNFIVMTLTGLFSQVVLPFIIFVYSIWLFIAYPLYYVLGLLLLIYLFYMFMNVVMYLLFVLLLSERPKEDISRFCYLPLSPIFSFIGRINAFVATIWELIHKGHKDSSMAPWWVTKKHKS